MGVRIQELPETTGINKEDLLIVEDGQGTKKGTVQQLDEALGVSQLKEDLGDLKKGIGVYEYISPNMFNKNTVTLNKTINSNGDIVDDHNNKYCVSDYVDVFGHNAIVLGFYNVGKWNTINTYIVAFDGEKNVIGIVTGKQIGRAHV